MAGGHKHEHYRADEVTDIGLEDQRVANLGGGTPITANQIITESVLGWDYILRHWPVTLARPIADVVLQAIVLHEESGT